MSSVALYILNISLHQRMKLLHLGHEEMFAFHGPIHNLVKAVGGGDRRLGGGVAVGELGRGSSLRERQNSGVKILTEQSVAQPTT